MARRAGWIDGGSLAELRRLVGAGPEETVEVCVAGNFRRVPFGHFERVFYPRVRGLLGMEIGFAGEVLRLAPTRMLAANLGFERALERFLEEREIEWHAFAREGRLHAFDAEQYLLLPEDGSRAVGLFRGGTPVEDAPGRIEDRAAALADGIEGWMLRNLSADGALPYKYWPSRGEESPADNAIRRFLASIALARLGRLRGSAELRDAARRNLRFNLARYFQPLGDGRGAIVERSGAKLGAAALAGLAIMENAGSDEFAEELTMLAAGIESLADDRNGFRTFFFPAERDGENWNFYSGEALLFWAEAARRGLAVAPAPDRCARTLELLRQRHCRNRNPAFVPWCTQACAALFARTGERRYADFALEMNDWLETMQQWDGLEPDLRGRFYDPDRPEFGPPHAASTGAYLEGYADALALARALGDAGRVSRYERIVQRGLRSLRQLQFRDRRDMFYVSRPARVLGGLRTEAYDNAVRLDSAAHALLAAVKLLRPMEFSVRAPPARHQRVAARLLDRQASGQGPASRWRLLAGSWRTAFFPKGGDEMTISGDSNGPWRHFTKLATGVDIQPLLEELDAGSELWLADTSRQRKVRCQRHTRTIFLRSPKKPLPPGARNANDVHESRLARTAASFPLALAFCERTAAGLGGALGRATLVTLLPGCQVFPHIDAGAYYRVRDRLHLVLKSAHGSPLSAGEETVVMREGELWAFDNKVLHSADNPSREARIHLIFDILPPPGRGFHVRPSLPGDPPLSTPA